MENDKEDIIQLKVLLVCSKLQPSKTRAVYWNKCFWFWHETKICAASNVMLVIQDKSTLNRRHAMGRRCSDRPWNDWILTKSTHSSSDIHVGRCKNYSIFQTSLLWLQLNWSQSSTCSDVLSDIHSLVSYLSWGFAWRFTRFACRRCACIQWNVHCMHLKTSIMQLEAFILPKKS